MPPPRQHYYFNLFGSKDIVVGGQIPTWSQRLNWKLNAWYTQLILPSQYACPRPQVHLVGISYTLVDLPGLPLQSGYDLIIFSVAQTANRGLIFLGSWLIECYPILKSRLLRFCMVLSGVFDLGEIISPDLLNLLKKYPLFYSYPYLHF